jgi:hypothetical protein
VLRGKGADNWHNAAYCGIVDLEGDDDIERGQIRPDIIWDEAKM